MRRVHYLLLLRRANLRQKTTGGVNMRDYELLFVLDPDLDEEQKATLVETVKSVINNGR